MENHIYIYIYHRVVVLNHKFICTLMWQSFAVFDWWITAVTHWCSVSHLIRTVLKLQKPGMVSFSPHPYLHMYIHLHVLFYKKWYLPLYVFTPQDPTDNCSLSLPWGSSFVKCLKKKKCIGPRSENTFGFWPLITFLDLVWRDYTWCHCWTTVSQVNLVSAVSVYC